MKPLVYEQEDVFDALRPEWNDLVHRSLSNTIFSTWEWASIWWSAYQPGDLWVVACRDDAGQLLGLAPWFIHHGEDGQRTVHLIGCEDVTDYLDIIVDADHADAVYACLAQVLADQRERYDQIELCNIPEASPTHQRFAAMLADCGFATQTAQRDVCPVIALPESFDDYLNSLNKKQRHEIRRKVRRAEALGDDLGWYIVGEDHDLDAEMDRFLRLMAASDPQKAIFLQDERNVSFFRQIIPAIQQAGHLFMAFITVQDEAVAAYVNFDYDGRIMVYNSGLDAGEFGHASPGIVLLTYLIEWSIEHRRQVFDFLRGDEIYKYRMGGQDTAVINLTARWSA